VVRGVAGRRQEYRPVLSRLTGSSTPYDVARAFAETFGLTELYLADLDAIAGAEPSWAVYDTLRRAGCRLWVDAGVRQAQRARQLGRAGLDVVVGLETVAGPAALAECVAALGERVVFSLDLRGGEPLGKVSAWAGADVWSIAAQALGLGVARLLVLDLGRVGAGSGTGTEALCARLAGADPNVEVWAGGGVRDRADLLRLRACGVGAVLLASALHDGALTRADLAGL
jgi:phosphoribosylformimino-5-aminoimidazole carboxamide ribotide isomerase